MPSTAICWSTYEFFKYLLGNTQELRLVTPTTSVLAEEKIHHDQSDDHPSQTHYEKVNFRSRDSGLARELPAMSGETLKYFDLTTSVDIRVTDIQAPPIVSLSEVI